MDNPDYVGSSRTSPWRAYAWGVLAALTCPCHLPVLAAVLAGTTAGAFIGVHWGIAALALTGLFVLSVGMTLRAFRGDHEHGPTHQSNAAGHDFTDSAGSPSASLTPTPSHGSTATRT